MLQQVIYTQQSKEAIMCKWTRQCTLWGKCVGAECTLFVTTVIYSMEILEHSSVVLVGDYIKVYDKPRHSP